MPAHACALESVFAAGQKCSYQRVISKATMINSFKTKAVYEIATMLMNSVSKKSSERIMMIPPVVALSAEEFISFGSSYPDRH